MRGRFLMDYYVTNEILMSTHKWNLEYIDNLVPYEKDLYLGFLNNRMKALQEADAARANL